MEIFKCKFCGESFTPKRKWQEFCDDKCRNNFHNDKKLVGTLLPLIRCPHCKEEIQSMLEKLRDSHYLCNTCSKEFFSHIILATNEPKNSPE